MRLLFLLCAGALLIAGLVTYVTEPGKRNEVPVIYWVIDPAPARPEQIALYHRWLVRKGHGTSHLLRTMDEVEAFRRRRWTEPVRRAIEEGSPAGAKAFAAGTGPGDLPLEVMVPGVEMRLDAASNDLYKKLVQGVSRVAGDVIEAYNGGQQMQFLASAGMLADVTESAEAYGFTPDRTYEALRPSLFYEGRQYAFPRNPAQTMYWGNRDAFRRVGQDPPPSRWDTAEFERLGRAYVAAANPPGGRREYFFADRALKSELRRSMGLDVFNETLTVCVLDDPRNARCLALIHRWTYDDHILPSAADKAGFDTEGGWGGQSFQLFKSGRYALFASGRWALMLFRQFGALPLAVSEPPHDGMPNTTLSGGQSTVFAGSRQRRYAELFLAYMADEDYNMQIVRDGDALPPNPVYTRSELFRQPPDHPNEWGCHEAYADAANTIAITQSFSPFVLPMTVLRVDSETEEEVMNDRMNPEEASRLAAERINEEMQRTLRESPKLRRRYEEAQAIQAAIEERRRSGEKVPAAWIANPFHRRWYREQGWLDEAPGETAE
ncbi:MAG: extracellular solute-binding protein [Lentisphaeria bacterium]|nr:extracellular solute-binding protein [Lentisphaeria bacterium]